MMLDIPTLPFYSPDVVSAVVGPMFYTATVLWYEGFELIKGLGLGKLELMDWTNGKMRCIPRGPINLPWLLPDRQSHTILDKAIVSLADIHVAIALLRPKMQRCLKQQIYSNYGLNCAMIKEDEEQLVQFHHP